MLPVLALVVDYVVGCHLDYLIDGVRHHDGVKVRHHGVLSPAFLLWMVLLDLGAVWSLAWLTVGVEGAILAPMIIEL